MLGLFHIKGQEGCSEEVTSELGSEGGGPSPVEGSEGEPQAEGTASAKVLGLDVFSGTTGEGNNSDDAITGAGAERRGVWQGSGHTRPCRSL